MRSSQWYLYVQYHMFTGYSNCMVHVYISFILHHIFTSRNPLDSPILEQAFRGKSGIPLSSPWVLIRSHGHPWLGWFGIPLLWDASVYPFTYPFTYSFILTIYHYIHLQYIYYVYINIQRLPMYISINFYYTFTDISISNLCFACIHLCYDYLAWLCKWTLCRWTVMMNVLFFSS